MTEPRFALALASNAPVSQALRVASAKTGAEFGYLVRTAMRESSMDPQAKSASSSATGLFQFVDQTWLGVMKRHGAEHGFARYADAIQTDSRGRQHVPDAELKAEILALRKDPRIASLMAGELTGENRDVLEQRLGRSVSHGELYVAHFMGAEGAAGLIRNAERNPDASAAALFPAAARANRSIFYGSDGQPRTVSEVYGRLTRENGGGSQGASDAVVAAARPAFRVPQPIERAPEPRQLASTANPGGMAVAASTAPRMPSKQPLVLSPNVISVLASLDPIPGRLRPERQDHERAFDRVA